MSMFDYVNNNLCEMYRFSGKCTDFYTSVPGKVDRMLAGLEKQSP